MAIALVDYHKCQPERCSGGACSAVLACQRKLLRQEAPYEVPMPLTSLCRACGDCARACPLEAVQVIKP